ncbi:MAG: AAA family ATPase, partial [Thermoplasmata archaeon]
MTDQCPTKDGMPSDKTKEKNGQKEVKMYLKEIQMRNFKTFTKPISINFERGFTAITGPNGSGKSNISDA